MKEVDTPNKINSVLDVSPIIQIRKLKAISSVDIPRINSITIGKIPIMGIKESNDEKER